MGVAIDVSDESAVETGVAATSATAGWTFSLAMPASRS